METSMPTRNVHHDSGKVDLIAEARRQSALLTTSASLKGFAERRVPTRHASPNNRRGPDSSTTHEAAKTMNIKSSFKQITAILLTFLFATLAGCGGSGGGGGGGVGDNIDPRAAITVDPAKYDFLTLTEDNSATPRDVVVQSAGSADLRISSIALFNTTAFTLDIDPEQDPCGPLVRADLPLKSGESCRFRVGFNPPKHDSPAEFEAASIIQSNATVPSFPLVLRGKYERASEINVAISQIEACDRPDVDATVYVSVTDQAGFPIKTLTGGDFSFREMPLGGEFALIEPVHLDGFVDQENLSVSLIMDYSGSITDRDLRNMETAATSFIRRLNEGDEAEIIKYDSKIITMQGFTSDQEKLERAIKEAPPLDRGGTAFYDAIFAATTGRIIGPESPERSEVRRAVVALTDGEDNSSSMTLERIIEEALMDGTPIFPVGFGDQKNPEVLRKLARETGGVYLDLDDSDNLETIYVRVADLLFANQYVLRYSSTLGPQESGFLEVEVTALGKSARATGKISACE